MAGRKPILQIGEIASGVLDPVLAKRAGIDSMLIGLWDEIAGPEFADCSRPEKIAWPRGRRGVSRPGTLTVACDGAQALFLLHAGNRLVERLNRAFGFPAVDRIRIVQKPVARQPPAPASACDLPEPERRQLGELVTGIESANLRGALVRLGAGIVARRFTPP